MLRNELHPCRARWLLVALIVFLELPIFAPLLALAVISVPVVALALALAVISVRAVARGREVRIPRLRRPAYGHRIARPFGSVRVRTPAGWANWLVDRIARHKAAMLGSAIVLAVVLAATAVVLALEGHGHRLNAVVSGVGGYVAIAGLVLGLPALGYAMVTDRAVEKLADALSVTKKQVDSLKERISKQIASFRKRVGVRLPKDHEVQVFVPNQDLSRLLPIYESREDGPEEGWRIDPAAPQAVTGSAWVENSYYFAVDEGLSNPKLRLTPEQHRRFKRLTGVAAAPIHDTEGERIGVVTIYTEGTPHMDDPSFIELHRQLAAELAPIVMEYVAGEGPLQGEQLHRIDARGHKLVRVEGTD